jgi:hypothetical protein
LIARVLPVHRRALPRPGQEVAVALNMDKAHFYDSETHAAVV